MVSFLLLQSWTATAEQFYIVPSNSTSCPKDPCHTLTDVVLNSSQYFTSDTIIVFLPGNHQTNISRHFSVLIKDVRNISMIGYDNTNSDSKSVIQCTRPLGFAFINVTTLKIGKLSFIFCGAKISSEFTYKKFPIQGSRMTLYFLRTTNITLSGVVINNSTEAGLLGINMFGLSNISHTIFNGNRPNCLIIFQENFKLKVIPSTHFNIANTQVMFGKIPKRLRSYHNWGATGLGIFLVQTTFNVHIHITNIKTLNNIRKEGSKWYGNLRFVIENWECQCSLFQVKQVTNTNTVEKNDKTQLRLNSISKKSALLAGCKCSKPAEEENIVQISDSYFEGVRIRIDADTKNCDIRIRLQNITVLNNILHISGMMSIEIQDMNQSTGMLIDDSNITVSGRCHFVHTHNIYTRIVSLFRSNISFYDVQFIGNRVEQDTVLLGNNSTIKFQHVAELVGNKGRVCGVIALYNSSQLVFGKQSNVTFLRNYAQQYGGAILVDSSTIVVESEAMAAFIENEAYNGGALALQNNARIMLKSNSRITFTKNHAQQYGGALYVQEPTPETNFHLYRYTIRCFFELSSHSHAFPRLTFANNTADTAGSSLYGGWVNFCTNSKGKPCRHIFTEIFHFQTLPAVSSNPTRVCVCINDLPDCTITHYNVTAYPGETFQIPAVAVGQMFGTVPFTVQSRFSSVNSSTPPQLKSLQQTQVVRKGCTNLTFTIVSSLDNEEMSLTVDKIDKLPTHFIIQYPDKKELPLVFRNLHLHIQLNPCPLGFVLNDSSCICHPKLHHGCNIDTQMVYRQSPKWINATFTNTSQYGVLVHEHCPFDYCKPKSFNLDLEDPDEQCAFRRSGILCGACQNNLSHVFGTSACWECSSLWALLWVPLIALAGIALVVLLIVLNLTVSVGTINGLIFYANIVRANHATFFPPNTTNSFLGWFIAWINLDLSIETCFYNGLDAYVKTWLQFVFPLYIWFLVITIIVLSHYYTLAAKLSGRNAVPVLATLFLISYAKLLRIIITVLQSTELEFPDNSVRKVWFYDGNVDYLKGKHIPLFIAALLLLLISLPYTAILIFIQYLQHRSSYKVLFWVQKLKPLIDAYTGPYKDKHRYWTGLLLLVRIVLFLTFSLNTRGSPEINLLAIIATVLLLFMQLAVAGGVYKTLSLNIIEYSSFLNLGILAAATTVTTWEQKAVVYTSASIAFALCILIVVFHTFTKLKSSQLWNWIPANIASKVQVKLYKLRSALGKLCHKWRSTQPSTQPGVSHFSIELRESLLESHDCSQ